MTERSADHAIEGIFIERWSPRAFTGEAMPASELMRLFEAARWAPSSYNSQPWRFLYAHRDTPHWDLFLGLLNEGNRAWASRAAVLMVALSKSIMRPIGADKDIPSHSHSFDAGAAWANLALQASAMGWAAHAMVGLRYGPRLRRAECPRRLPRGMCDCPSAAAVTPRSSRSPCRSGRRPTAVIP